MKDQEKETGLTTDKKKRFNIEKGECPMESILCVFFIKDAINVKIGFLCFGKHGHFIQDYESWERYSCEGINEYAEVLNEKGGYIFSAPVSQVTEKKELFASLHTILVEYENDPSNSYSSIITKIIDLFNSLHTPKQKEAIVFDEETADLVLKSFNYYLNMGIGDGDPFTTVSLIDAKKAIQKYIEIVSPKAPEKE